MPTSLEWKSYYVENAASLLEIPWVRGPDLTPAEVRIIAKSLREFQAGESSEGRQLLSRAKRYAEETGDGAYFDAIRLFIAEEQRHARDLARGLAINEISLVKTTFPDRVFRFVRHLFGTLEVSIAVLVTAEIVAKVYYPALREATCSVVLRRLCDQISRDEIQHVRFQSEQLALLRTTRGADRNGDDHDGATVPVLGNDPSSLARSSVSNSGRRAFLDGMVPGVRE